jgi:hypothetical protein
MGRGGGGGGGERHLERKKEGQCATIKAGQILELEHVLVTVEVRCVKYLEIISILPSVFILLNSIAHPDPDPDHIPHQIER